MNRLASAIPLFFTIACNVQEWPTPTISRVFPIEAKLGELISIHGENLVGPPVFIGSQEVTPLASSHEEELLIAVPLDSRGGPIKVGEVAYPEPIRIKTFERRKTHYHWLNLTADRNEACGLTSEAEVYCWTVGARSVSSVFPRLTQVGAGVEWATIPQGDFRCGLTRMGTVACLHDKNIAADFSGTWKDLVVVGNQLNSQFLCGVDSLGVAKCSDYPLSEISEVDVVEVGANASSIGIYFFKQNGQLVLAAPYVYGFPKGQPIEGAWKKTAANLATASNNLYALEDTGPVLIFSALPSHDQVSYAKGTICIRQGTSVSCAGDNSNWRLGAYPEIRSPSFQFATMATDVTAIAVGDDYVCAGEADGTLVCWGGEFAKWP